MVARGEAIGFASNVYEMGHKCDRTADFLTDISFAKLAINHAFDFCNGGGNRQPWLLQTCCADVDVDSKLITQGCDALANDLQSRIGECWTAYSPR